MSDMKQHELSEALGQLAEARQNIEALKMVLNYNQRDNVGMVRGDGEMMRYFTYLARKIEKHSSEAERRLKNGGVDYPLPF